MNARNSQHRVILVFLLFVPLALLSMWVVGGGEQQLSVSVNSDLPARELAERFEQLVQRLELLDETQFTSQAMKLLSPEGDVLTRTMPVSYPGNSGVGVTGTNVFPLADIVSSDVDSERQEFSIDPAVIFSDSNFQNATQVELTWFGRDNGNVYLKEVDQNERSRLVKLGRKNLQFEAYRTDGKVGSTITYNFSIHHKGLRRIYGKFLERDCEGCVLKRIDWICKQLEMELQSSQQIVQLTNVQLTNSPSIK